MNCKKTNLNFPLAETFLLGQNSQKSPENLLFFDIETTGLSWKRSMVFLIGFLKKNSEKNDWILEQWFLDDPCQEKELLEMFTDAVKKETFLVHFNGKKFDLPYLKGRCQLLDIPVTWEDCSQLDLYQALQPYQKLLGLNHLRLSDLERFLGIRRLEEISGRECTAVYKKYVMDRDSSKEELLLLHNRQDLTGLLGSLPALAYPAFFQGQFQVDKWELSPETLICTLALRLPLPRDFSLDCHPKPWTISGYQDHAQITFHLEKGQLRMYYPNYHDYYYLPEEETAIHKSVGAYVDRSCRRPATAENCFTRFLCSERFIQDASRLDSYIRNCLSVSL